MTAKKEKSPMSKPEFFEPKLKESKKERQTFTKEQVTELLKKQITACANSIQVSNQIEYNAKRKIMLTKIVEE
jgi:hypothetical protein